MLTIGINNTYFYKVASDKLNTRVNDQITTFDLQSAGNNRFHIIRDNRSYLTEVISYDPAEKSGIIRVNSNKYHFTVKDQYDDLLHKLGIDKLHLSAISELKAPMPGMVLEILVTEGQQVKKGDNLLILEAMKMENIIKSPADLTIGAVKTKAGNKVEKNQIILTFS